MPTSELVIDLAYHIFLGRRAESTDVVEEMAKSLNSVAEVREHFLASDEFRRNYAPNAKLIRNHLDAQFVGAVSQVDVQVAPGELAELFSRVEAQWTALGASEPYWSVLSDDRFKAQNIDSNLSEFNASGKHVVDILETLAARNSYDIDVNACFELGCGVGRITRFLAKRFRRVVAADISPGNLRICDHYLQSSGVENVSTFLLKKIEGLADIGTFSGFVSMIVLQHNPPPVQVYMLNQILARIEPGGFCLFQVPTAGGHYSYSVKQHLSSPREMMDMHCLPMRHVFEVLRSHEFAVMEVLKDSWAGDELHSHTFFAVKNK